MQQDQWSARFIGDLRATLNNYASTLGYTPEDVKQIGKDLGFTCYTVDADTRIRSELKARSESAPVHAEISLLSE